MSAADLTVDANPGVAEPDAETTVRSYRDAQRRRRLVVAGLAVLAVGLIVADLLVGQEMAPGLVFRALLDPASVLPVDRQIVWTIRLPMAVAAVLVGVALGAAGAEMQTILNNPLAEPYTLGISAAAGFGAALVTVTGVGVGVTGIGQGVGMAGSAWIFAMLAAGFIVLGARAGGTNAETMILLGIAIVFLFDALLAMLQYLASQTQLEQVVFWTLGSLARASWPQLGILAAMIIVVVPLMYRRSWQLTAFRLGDVRAESLGVRVARTRLLIMLGCSLLAATAVSIAGTIGFVGLVAPHIARLLVGEDHRYYLPVSMITGAVLLSAASTVSKIILPGVIIPIGIITAVVGVPVFITIVLTRRSRTWH